MNGQNIFLHGLLHITAEWASNYLIRFQKLIVKRNSQLQIPEYNPFPFLPGEYIYVSWQVCLLQMSHLVCHSPQLVSQVLFWSLPSPVLYCPRTNNIQWIHGTKTNSNS